MRKVSHSIQKLKDTSLYQPLCVVQKMDIETQIIQLNHQRNYDELTDLVTNTSTQEVNINEIPSTTTIDSPTTC